MAASAGPSGAVSTYLSRFTSPLHSLCSEHSEVLSVSWMPHAASGLRSWYLLCSVPFFPLIPLTG